MHTPHRMAEETRYEVPLLLWTCTHRASAVANSGGPDSTCLLYLMSSLIREKKGKPGLPQSIVSIHVNHKLQAAADDMANHAAKTANILSVPHFGTEIPWGSHPFPAKPVDGTPMEHHARRSRFNRLFEAMTALKASCLAFGQHADDQVETAIMRLATGSGALGASGMSPIRRWGMGGITELEFNGYEGMNRFIIRPFLEVSKDRILATCEANNLEYVTDHTNFQPDIALRNKIRAILTERLKYPNQDDTESSAPTSVSEQEAKFHKAIRKLGDEAFHTEGRAGLYDSVKRISDKVQTINLKVTNILRRVRLPSPPSTILISTEDLQTITDVEVAIALSRRIMRHISPFPYGHISAEAKGNRSGFEDLVRKVWSGGMGDDEKDTHAWCFGSHVLWSPVTLTANGRVRWRPPRSPDEKAAWLISREPPMSPTRWQQNGKVDPLTTDVTLILNKRLVAGDTARVLYDCRFLISFFVDRMPDSIKASLADPAQNASIVIEPHTKFYLPKVVLRREGYKDEVLTVAEWKMGAAWDRWKFHFRPATKGWIGVKYVRPWSHI
ncbi:unnamed protein product [Somion occarium]|uniref:tRNA(Ile)-lysidine synthetase n=1 Tax=Somion occarium TaxID=3059160 RepID=A0ABP1DCM6_9APHY